MEHTNRSLLVLVDSRQGESYADVAPGILAALDHWGMPYRCHDLAAGQPGSGSILHCAAVVLAQENVCAVLTDETARCIEQAVAGGIGYVGCDSRVGFAPSALQPVLGVRAHDILPVCGTQAADTGHWVSEWQDPRVRYRFKHSLPMTAVSPQTPRVRVFLESDGHPALWVAQHGAGHVVQWALSCGVWQRSVFGHCEGLDDLLWRGLVWAARKPFAMLAMPPFSTAVVGDAMGAHDLAWIESLDACGFPPHVGVFPDDMDAISEIRGQSGFFDRAVDAMGRYAADGVAEFSPQAATWNRAYLFYSRADGSEIPVPELAQRLGAVDKQFARYGIPWSRTVHPHFHQIGYDALPFLQQRGVEFTLSGQLPGETWEGVHRSWPCAPYGHPGFAVAPLPQSSAFYVVTAGWSHHHTTQRVRSDAYRIRPDVYAYENDLMWGRTRWQNQCRIDDWDAMADAAVRQARLGLHALFFACPSTREQTIAFVRLHEWQALWDEVERRLSRYERWPALYSDIAAYARAKAQTRLVSAGFDGAVLSCGLAGSSDVPLYLYLWGELGDRERPGLDYREVSSFVDVCQVTIPV